MIFEPRRQLRPSLFIAAAVILHLVKQFVRRQLGEGMQIAELVELPAKPVDGSRILGFDNKIAVRKVIEVYVILESAFCVELLSFWFELLCHIFYPWLVPPS